MTTEERLDALEQKVDTLIENLRLNHNDLLDVLNVLASEPGPGDRAAAVANFGNIICPRNPPGC